MTLKIITFINEGDNVIIRVAHLSACQQHEQTVTKYWKVAGLVKGMTD